MTSDVLDDTRRSRGVRTLSFERAYLGGLFVAFSALAFLFPRSGDDWAWGSQLGIDRLHNWFRNYNGRYAGDLVVLALTRTPVLTQLVTGAVLTLIVFLIVDLAGKRTPLGYLTATTLLLAMPRGEWRQAIVWLSGFTNYAFATAGALVFLWAAKRDWTGRLVAAHRWRRAPVIVVFGFVTALFMENVTIYLVVAALVSVVAYRLVFRRFSLDSLAWLVSFVVGAAVMFSNGAYRNTGKSSNYQQIQPGGGGLKSDVKSLGDLVYQFAIGDNTILNIALVLVVCLLAGTAAATVGWRQARVPAVLAGGFLAANAVLTLVKDNLTPSEAWRVLGGYVSALLLLGALCTTALVVVRDRTTRIQVLVGVASVVLVSAPMAAVHPIGPRCFFVSYVFLLIVVGSLLGELAERLDPHFALRLSPFVAAVGAALLVSYFVVYALVTHAANGRLDHVRAKVRQGAATVRVSPLPFSSYVHYGDPAGATWEHRFKLYYDLPESLHIVVKGKTHP